MLKQAISDKSGSTVAVNTVDKEDVALVVATRPHKLYRSRRIFFADEFDNTEMAREASFGATPERVHDGTDNPYWTGTIRKGTWTLDDTGTIPDHTPDDNGDRCIKGVGTGKDGEIELSHPTSIDLTSYEAVTGWIYVTGWNGDKNLELKPRFDGGNIGDKVNVNDYFPVGTQDVWQKFIIPLSNLGLTGKTIDAFRFKNKDNGNNFFLDDIQIEEIGVEFRTYRVEPDMGTNLYVNKIFTTYVAPLDMDHADATAPFLSYNNTLGVVLANGWLYQRIQDGKVMSSQTVKALHDASYTGAKIQDVICDGVNTMLTIEYTFPVPEIFKSENLDLLRIQMQDANMDDFISMRVLVLGYQEYN